MLFLRGMLVVACLLVVAYTVLSVPFGKHAANDAGYLAYALTAPTLERMAKHPDGM